MMHYRILATFGVLFVLNLSAQERYQLINPEVSFYSHAPVEDIEAKNSTSIGVIDFSAQKFSFRVKIKDFVFESSLMRDHFNENYMESDQFPNGTFKGEITGNYDISKDGSYEVVANGDLTIHGITKKVSLPSKITVKEGDIQIYSQFDVALADYNIEVPQLLFKKIAEVIQVTFTSGLKRMK